jgi:hypothetical protein
MKQQQKSNRRLVGFTAILAIASIIQATATLSPSYSPLFIGGFLSVFISAIALISWEYDLIPFQSEDSGLV